MTIFRRNIGFSQTLSVKPPPVAQTTALSYASYRNLLKDIQVCLEYDVLEGKMQMHSWRNQSVYYFGNCTVSLNNVYKEILTLSELNEVS